MWVYLNNRVKSSRVNKGSSASQEEVESWVELSRLVVESRVKSSQEGVESSRVF